LKNAGYLLRSSSNPNQQELPHLLLAAYDFSSQVSEDPERAGI
jgi:hypothetical protein